MSTQTGAGNDKSEMIRSLLSEGQSSEMILANHPEFQKSDILREAEQLLPSRDRFRALNPSVDHLLKNHPRALASWNKKEDQLLQCMRTEGRTIFE
ncbi:hypothetical protein K8I31_09735, partial [bacterium]|nr:hypothetical protein [bacterium]